MVKITASANQRKKYFTLRKYVNNKLVTKYRTSKMCSESFEEAEMNTSENWIEFLTYGIYVEIK